MGLWEFLISTFAAFSDFRWVVSYVEAENETTHSNVNTPILRPKYDGSKINSITKLPNPMLEQWHVSFERVDV